MMTPREAPVVKVKPSSNVYTVLLIVAILILAFATGTVVHDLMQNYGLTFAELFSGQKAPPV
ncbi:MAG TPA: hypothetical protein VM389_01080 [Phycisphaerae bacterium]|nr:hypothetical protein [Phycisphaerae bacterium]HUU21103.1 hypothetical protein [Phycisphaerae bacterium]